MARIAHSMTAAADRSLALQTRMDLQIEPSQFQGEQAWVVKDPVSLKYYRLGKPEFIVLTMLREETSLTAIRERLTEEFPTKIVRLQQLQQLIASLYQSGMLLSDAPGQSEMLLSRAAKTSRRQWAGRLSNVLSIRFPGYDPERLLSWLHPKLGWIFGPVGILLWAVLAIAAGGLVLTHFDDFRQRLPHVQQFFSAQNFAWMALAMAAAKVCHELGHGLSCKYFGGECHEIGFMLLVFTPAMYCDTSDSWLLRNKWHRAFIGFAGMYVEIFLASIATFAWWYTQPGTFNFLCLNIMFVSSVSTLVFNINPLLRYDGYYIASDLLEIPNLSQKSRLAMLDLLRVHCLGMQPISRRRLPRRKTLLFATYSVASIIYRWAMIIMIAWFVTKIFEPYGLQIVGHAILAVSFIGMIGLPMWQLIKYFAVPGRIQEVNTFRFLVSAGIVAVVLGGLCLIPIPESITATVVIRPDQAEDIYVTTPGTVSKILVRPGEHVTAGQPIAILDNLDMKLKLASLVSREKQQQRRLDLLKRQRSHQSNVAAQIPEAAAALNKTVAEIRQLKKESQRLQLVSSIDGVLLPPVEIVERTDDRMLPTWHGTPFDQVNMNMFLQRGSLFCAVGKPQHMKATLIFDQRHLQSIRPGQTARIVLDELPLQTLTGQIREVSKMDMQTTPRELTTEAGGPLATQLDPATGARTPMFVMYEASVPLPATDSPLMVGFRGKAKIRVGSTPVAARMIKFTRDTLHFR